MKATTVPVFQVLPSYWKGEMQGIPVQFLVDYNSNQDQIPFGSKNNFFLPLLKSPGNSTTLLHPLAVLRWNNSMLDLICKVLFCTGISASFQIKIMKYLVKCPKRHRIQCANPHVNHPESSFHYNSIFLAKHSALQYSKIGEPSCLWENVTTSSDVKRMLKMPYNPSAWISGK